MPPLRWCFIFSWLQFACSEIPACLLVTPICPSDSGTLFSGWCGISFCFPGIRCQLSCPEFTRPERLFPRHLSNHICLFCSSYPRPSFSFFCDVDRLPVPWTVHMWDSPEAEAKVVEGGRERIYPLNYRDSLIKKGIFITVVFLRFWSGKSSPPFSVRGWFFRALTVNQISPLEYMIAWNVLVFSCWKDYALCNGFCSVLTSQPSGSGNSGRQATWAEPHCSHWAEPCV